MTLLSDSNVGYVIRIVRSVINRIILRRAKCGRRSQLQHPAVSFRRPARYARLIIGQHYRDERERGGGGIEPTRRTFFFPPFHPTAETESPCAFG